MLVITIPGKRTLELVHLVLDLNGTIAENGALVRGVAKRLHRLRKQLTLHLVTADTRGGAARLAHHLGLNLHRVEQPGEVEQKAEVITRLGPQTTVAIGNGANDVAMLKRSVLGIAVLGKEGMCPAILSVSDVLVREVNDGLDLLLFPDRLIATLRE